MLSQHSTKVLHAQPSGVFLNPFSTLIFEAGASHLKLLALARLLANKPLGAYCLQIPTLV